MRRYSLESIYGLIYSNGRTTATYYYITNLQGDVMYLVDENGNEAASYTYDPYGKILSATGTMASANPLRYRGYYYDTETGFYYLRSRYYDPAVGRFINADEYASSGQGYLGYNMFSYCGNNPVTRKDASGTSWLGAVVGAVVNVATTYIAAKVTGQDYTLLDAGVAALSGALNVLSPFVSGFVSGVYTFGMAVANGANFGEAILCGTVSAVLTTASISNLASAATGPLDVLTAAACDVVFGTGYNNMSAATYKAVTTNAQARVETRTKSYDPAVRNSRSLAKAQRSFTLIQQIK